MTELDGDVSYHVDFFIGWSFCILLHGHVLAASFDCAHAKLALEAVICNDPEINSLDNQVAAQFRNLRTVLPRERSADLLREQRRFIRSTTDCAADRECVRADYRERLAKLCEIGSASGAPCARQAGHVATSGGTLGVGMGRCHMETCGWFKIQSIRRLDQRFGAALYGVQSTYGESEHPNDRYPDKYSPSLRIKWEKTSNSFVFCSKAVPVVIFNDDHKPDVLNFSEIAGFQEFEANFYMRVCHGAPAYMWDNASAMRKYGYRSPSTDNVSIRSPEDLFRYVK